LCQYNDYRKCYVNITEPALYKGCREGKTDSDYYVYSIQGYDPCNFVDFDSENSYNIKFILDCRDINDLAIVKENGHSEGI